MHLFLCSCNYIDYVYIYICVFLPLPLKGGRRHQGVPQHELPSHSEKAHSLSNRDTKATCELSMHWTSMPFSEQSKFTSLHLSYADPYPGSETEHDYCTLQRFTDCCSTSMLQCCNMLHHDLLMESYYRPHAVTLTCRNRWIPMDIDGFRWIWVMPLLPNADSSCSVEAQVFHGLCHLLQEGSMLELCLENHFGGLRLSPSSLSQDPHWKVPWHGRLQSSHFANLWNGEIHYFHEFPIVKPRYLANHNEHLLGTIHSILIYFACVLHQTNQSCNHTNRIQCPSGAIFFRFGYGWDMIKYHVALLPLQCWTIAPQQDHSWSLWNCDLRCSTRQSLEPGRTACGHFPLTPNHTSPRVGHLDPIQVQLSRKAFRPTKSKGSARSLGDQNVWETI